MFSQEQEVFIVDMVRQNNAIPLPDIQQRVLEDNFFFEGINSVSCSLQRNHIHMKQEYRVPFEHNSEGVKDLGHQYVQVSKLSDIFSADAYSTLLSF